MLGETLHLTVRDGRELTASFAGYAERSLLLRDPSGSSLRVPFESAVEIHRGDGTRIDPGALARAFRADSLPSAEALSIEQRSPMSGMARPWIHDVRVPLQDILSASVRLSSGVNVVGVILVSVLVSVVIVALVLYSIASSFEKSCATFPGDINLLPGMRSVDLTQRPFDRSRSCFVGDPLAVADPWPSSTGGAAITALADPVSADDLAR